MSSRYRKPYWAGSKWVVQTIARCDMAHINAKKGDWVDIYRASTKAEAQRLADDWSRKLDGDKTRIVPGIGHPSQAHRR